MPSPLTKYQATVEALSHYRAVMSRAKRIQMRQRHAAGVGPGRPPKISFQAAIEMVKGDIEAHERAAAARQARLAAHPPPAPREPLPHEVREDRAAMRSARWRAAHPDYFRARRLTTKYAHAHDLGVAPDVWAEIVTHFRACCACCGAPASRLARLHDNTPVPACLTHDGVVWNGTAWVAPNVQGAGS